MRIFLIIFSFINAFLYFLVYAYFENILELFSNINITGGFVGFIKILLLIIISFLIGLVVSLLLRNKIDKSFFDYQIALIVGILPFIFLILSQGSIINTIVTNVFGSNRQISDIFFYFFSRRIVWAMWFGFAIGASVRIAFDKRIKHAKSYDSDYEKLDQFDKVLNN